MNTRFKTFFFSLVVVGTSSSYAADFNKACEMYLHHNFGGPKYLVYEGAEVGFIGKSWNDQVSSVIVPAGCQLKVYLHWHFDGFDNTYTPGSHSYVGDAWNDQISSVKCICN